MGWEEPETTNTLLFWKETVFRLRVFFMVLSDP